MTEAPRALVLVHERANGPGTLATHLTARGWRLRLHHVLPDDQRPDRPDPLPGPDEVGRHQMLVVLGSIRSVYDRATIGSWIGHELALVAGAHRVGVPVLGICFGGQVLAAALGGTVEPAPESEIGWYRLDGERNPVGVGPWFEWHHDRFEPPPGAEVLATTARAVQLFRVGTSVGTQFHPEIDLAQVERWVGEAPPDELARVGVDGGHLLAETGRQEARAVAACRHLVDWFLDEVVAPAPVSGATWPGSGPRS